MDLTDSSRSRFGRQTVGAALMAVGVLMVGASLVAPSLSLGRTAWSDEQAAEYQSTSARLHQLSHQHAQAPSPEAAATVRDELEQTQTDYRRLRGQLDTARGLTGRMATILRIGGAVLAVAGVVVVLSGRQA